MIDIGKVKVFKFSFHELVLKASQKVYLEIHFKNPDWF